MAAPTDTALAPGADLSRFVQRVRVLWRGPSHGDYVRVPDGTVELVVRVTSTTCDVHALGPREQVVRKAPSEVPPDTLGIQFKPGGAYPFFGLPMSELSHRSLAIDTLWGKEDGAKLRESLARAPNPQARLRTLEAALVDRLHRDDVYEPAAAYLVRRGIRLLTGAGELPRVADLARTLGVSERHLRRAFDDVLGMGPKAYARLVRFQRALQASRAQGARPDWGSIAAGAGYYDQAHLIADFRAVLGTTPGAWARARAA
ncbi:helix-turn-helix domain-containing protein [Corallococcus sp. AB049A]|uniref:Helix-turn-helix domain-containing protein n=1 Tax=Corallococcus interemptor TaxID=2316720 RepID=A0A3A8Q5E2_9BACT|nr:MULTISPECIES: AraC family transcriptional regulator [Corallococcus]RKH41104.1 helix-turn-helix domain-containing protein [Corallococcus sp. AB050B]RKH62721.1 helix-turn-helix domain-containing protein [Corallococcus interemptor]RKI67299.1 helix-turn-helix domain-containing protein [Corallococcus sp. AB049A]